MIEEVIIYHVSVEFASQFGNNYGILELWVMSLKIMRLFDFLRISNGLKLPFNRNMF